MESEKPIRYRLLDAFRGRLFTTQDAYKEITDYSRATVRARVYENLGILFKRVSRGVYMASGEGGEALLLEGNGRNLSFLEDASIDAIVIDHPWLDPKANKGGNRNFATYSAFEYTDADFVEKARVLKPGHFLVEFIPNESATNYEYLYRIKKMAEQAGFEYYAKVPWEKTGFVANTGRTAKNSEDVLFFTLGKPLSLRPDAKKDKAEPAVKHYLAGAAGMLPTAFKVAPPAKKERYHQAEKPWQLLREIMQFITVPGDIVLDQFAGSGSTGVGAIKCHRNAIMVEKAHAFVETIVKRFQKKQLGLTVFRTCDLSQEEVVSQAAEA